MIDIMLTTVVIIPTICYALAACIFWYQGDMWPGIMWLGYAIANISIMKQQGLI